MIDPVALQQAFNQLQQVSNGAARMARDAQAELQRMRQFVQQMQGEQAQMRSHLQQWGQDVSGISVKTSIGAGTGRPDLLHIEDIPGRRVPYDIVIAVGIPANLTSPVTATYTLSMDGPFVAVARAATFMSSYSFQVQVGEASVRYVGRSWGRQRPISSVLDINDALQGNTNIPMQDESSYTCPAAPPPVMGQVIPNNKSPFRTMEWDGFIELRNTVYPRQNAQVPSALWAPGWGQSMQLPVLDYWEKGDIIEFQVEPSHVNNPPAGNVQALLGSMPYQASGYDSVEGVAYPTYTCESSVEDVVQRRPDGILYLHLIGFKVLQPTGVAVR